MRIGKVALVAVVALGAVVAIKLGIVDGRRAKAAAYNAVDTVRGAGNSAIGTVGGAANAVTGGGERHNADCAAKCRANLAAIDSAKKRVVRAAGYSTGAVPRSAVEREMGGRIPPCPCGGTYTMGNEQQYPSCTLMPGG